jgi:CysZ protein
MQELISGFKYALSGFGLITRPGIRLYVLVPLLINAVIFTGVIIYGVHALNEFIDSFLTGWWEWLRWLLWPVFIMIAFAVIFFGFSIIANLLAAPFNGFLAGAVETSITGNTPQPDGSLPLSREIARTVASEGRKVIYFLVRAIPLLVLFFIPFINIAAPLLWLLFGAWMLALEYLDFTTGNHGLMFPELRALVKTRRPLTFGFGLGALLLTVIPVVNFIAIPAAVCGATRMWVEKIKPDLASYQGSNLNS